MRYALILLITCLCLGYGSARGQDLIITTIGDSIKCKIIDIGTDYIVFEAVDKQKELINRRRVAKIDYDFYSKEIRVPPPNTDWSTIRAGIDGGFSLLTGKTKEVPDDDLMEYYKKLKTGWNIGASGAYFFREYFGAGLKYSLMKSSNSADNLSLNTMDKRLLTGSFSSRVSIHYVGPELVVRYYLPETKFCFLLDFGIGYMHYANKESFDENGTNYSESYKITGGCIGLSIGLNADYSIRESYAVGIGFSYTYGSLGEYEINKGGTIEVIGLSGEDRQKLSHFDFTIGFRWSYF